MFLAADIGGTKSLFAIFQNKRNKPILLFKKIYASKDFASFEAVLAKFLSDALPTLNLTRIEAACFSLAGPVYDNSCNLTNLNWIIKAKNLYFHFPFINNIVLCNDLVAVARSIDYLPEKDFFNLTSNVTNKNQETKALIAPGTGLGEALLIKGHALPSEGGHCEFGPRTEKEVRLWRFLQQKYGHVSYERLLSGPGLVNLLHFLITEKGGNQSNYNLSPEEITTRALHGQCPLCQRVLELFISILGAEAGNLALKTMSMGGIYFGGGIVPHILPKLQDGTFLDSFRDKGRFSSLMKNIPVYVILNKEAALYGAAQLAINYS